MTASPVLCAVTLPDSSTVATPESELLHAKSGFSVAFSGITVTVSCTVCPICTVFVSAIEIPVIGTFAPSSFEQPARPAASMSVNAVRILFIIAVYCMVSFAL